VEKRKLEVCVGVDQRGQDRHSSEREGSLERVSADTVNPAIADGDAPVAKGRA
jgi:hypothetical protein